MPYIRRVIRSSITRPYARCRHAVVYSTSYTINAGAMRAWTDLSAHWRLLLVLMSLASLAAGTQAATGADALASLRSVMRPWWALAPNPPVYPASFEVRHHFLQQKLASRPATTCGTDIQKQLLVVPVNEPPDAVRPSHAVPTPSAGCRPNTHSGVCQAAEPVLCNTISLLANSTDGPGSHDCIVSPCTLAGAHPIHWQPALCQGGPDPWPQVGSEQWF